MVLTESIMLPLGSTAPDFDLFEVVTGQRCRRSDFDDQQLLLVLFICRHCPFVKHIQTQLADLGRDYQTRSVGICAISANDADHYPEDAPSKLREMAEQLDFRFPLCYDETQAVALAYRAVCTPDFFLFDHDRRLVYRGQLDDSRPGNHQPVNGKDLRAAIEAALAHQPIPSPQKPSIGCNIKWKPGVNPPALR
ncbi:thioredoxin family protein [Lyngbya confervoides]|uniref:Thioredoxin family protein n=1 Tax=Lyngbya confervoides BDU141951 TaxID=1574623 RepID=A0ABD4T5K9_9CYAN|nr:thioredoxin family protein [Lyngbya confervoides]MCM1983532.1 thioredoxin family protein [Lyngbya confervoides BDU141951]